MFECLNLRNVLVVALLIRVGALFAMHDGLSQDTDAYQLLGDNLAQHGVFGIGQQPTAYRPPLYPLVLSAIGMVLVPNTLAIGLAHLLMGMATVLLVYRLAHLWGFKTELSAMAALLVAVDPILLNQSAKIMSETLATLCTTICLIRLTIAGQRKTMAAWAVAGALIAVSSHCRANFLVWLMCIAVCLMWLELRSTRRLWQTLAFLLTAAVVLAPWTVRNWMLLGSPVVATTHGGYTLRLGNNDSFFTHLAEGNGNTVWEPDHSIPPRDPSVSEIQYDTENYSAAWRTMQQQPAMTCYASLLRTRRLWGIVPHKLGPKESWGICSGRYLVGVWNVVIFAASSFGCIVVRGKLYKTPWLWGLLLCIGWTVVHVLFWSNLRMRAPLVPVIALAAATGMEAIIGCRVRGGKSKGRNGINRTC